jgi:glyoxylase-like metal-dependent hydrolase (beta-lactamase superfamily II)
VGKTGTLIVDAGNSPAHANLLLNELPQVTQVPPKFLVLTHGHWDHVFGTTAFDVPIIASADTRRLVAEMADLDWRNTALDQRVAAGTEIEFCRDMIKAEWPDRSTLQLRIPDITFTDRLDLHLGSVTCQVIHVGGDHALDSSVVYVPEDRIVFLGDCLYEDLHHGPRNYTIPRLFPLIDRLLAFKADFYIWSHHPAPMSGAEMVEFTTLLRTIGSMIEKSGPKRNQVLATLQATLAEPLNEDQIEIVDSFLAGLPFSAM